MKQSELLRKQADMMDMAEKYGIDDWRKLVRVYHSGSETWLSFASRECLFSIEQYHSHKFALGVVEGRPVFEGDTLYFNGIPARIRTSLNLDGWTWNPPKPRTVMVELLREDAEAIARDHYELVRLREACRKALEKLK